MIAEIVRRRCREAADLIAGLDGQADRIAAIAEQYRRAFVGGGTVFFAGNGGSAAHAQHIAAEYSVRFRAERPPYRAMALTPDAPGLTAAGNDLGFDQIYARQIEALARPGDLLVVVSTSGQSPNLLEAARAARRRGIAVVGLLGRDGGLLAGLVDDALVVQSGDTARIQEAHLVIDHIIVEMIERGGAS
ncbi:MAG: SIS domain-containing protein [Gemmatimonadetes bacterium]|nr:SIS domain-containing protein [Gemmatimonadota bacterium]